MDPAGLQESVKKLESSLSDLKTTSTQHSQHLNAKLQQEVQLTKQVRASGRVRGRWRGTQKLNAAQGSVNSGRDRGNGAAHAAAE